LRQGDIVWRRIAGSGVVHMTGGLMALIGDWLLGRDKDILTIVTKGYYWKSLRIYLAIQLHCM